MSLFISIGINAQIQISNFTYNSVSSGSPYGFVEYNDKIYFIGRTDGFGSEIWQSDGTNINTKILKDINPGESDAINLTLLSATLNNELYFVAKSVHPYIGGEIWKTDGTEQGTTKVISYTGRTYGLTTVGNQIYFIVLTDETSLEIWKTDGTALGTTMVKGGIKALSPPSFQGKINNTFIFYAVIDESGYKNKVWRSDGTTNGTYPITDDLDGNGSSNGTLSQYIEYNNKLYFVSRYFLHETDGTLENTKVIANLWNATTNLVDFSDVIEVNNKLYFLFYSMDLLKLSIYESDGTSSGTNEIYTDISDQYFYPSYLSKKNDDLLFTTVNNTKGTSLKSLNTNNHEVSDLVELDKNLAQPTTFFDPFNACSIDKINGTDYILTTNTSGTRKKGRIYNSSSNTINDPEALSSLYMNIPNFTSYGIIYNQELYYSKENQVWKYDQNSLSNKAQAYNLSTSIHPNPSSGFLYLNTSNKIKNISIYDINSRLIFENQELNNGKIDITELKKGVYFLKINYNGNIVTKKIIKK
ncbi:T9SS type A sorting domain-containing protein [Flavivirga spongiicola]